MSHSEPGDWRRKIWIAIGLLLAGVHIVIAVVRVRIDDSDLIDFHLTCLHWWQTGQFTQEFGLRHYLPAFVVLMTPLMAWPLMVTASLWAVINVSLLWLTVREVGRVLKREYGSLPFHVRWIWPILLVLPYAGGTIDLGQVNLAVLCLCVLAYSRGWRPRRDILAGGLIALAAVIKIYPLVQAFFWLARGRWRTFVSAGVGFVVLAGGLSLAGFGFTGSIGAHREWFDDVCGRQYRSPAEQGAGGAFSGHLLYLQQRNQFHRRNNQSLAVVVRRLTTDLGRAEGCDPPVHVVDLPVARAYRLYLAGAVTVFAFLVLASWTGRNQPEGFGALAAWLAGVIAFVPIFWTHYFVLALPAFCVLAAEIWTKRQQHRPAKWAGALRLGWLAAIVCLGSDELRLVGLHCGLMLVTMAWLMTRTRAVRVSPSLAGSAQR